MWGNADKRELITLNRIWPGNEADSLSHELYFLLLTFATKDQILVAYKMLSGFNCHNMPLPRREVGILKDCPTQGEMKCKQISQKYLFPWCLRYYVKISPTPTQSGKTNSDDNIVMLGLKVPLPLLLGCWEKCPLECFCAGCAKITGDDGEHQGYYVTNLLPNIMEIYLSEFSKLFPTHHSLSIWLKSSKHCHCKVISMGISSIAGWLIRHFSVW